MKNIHNSWNIFSKVEANLLQQKVKKICRWVHIISRHLKSWTEFISFIVYDLQVSTNYLQPPANFFHFFPKVVVNLLQLLKKYSRNYGYSS